MKKRILLLAIIMIASVSLISCESKSSQIVSIPQEKIVIIDGVTTHIDNITKTTYKVKRIEHGVVAFVTMQGTNRYEAGDTIYWRIP